MRIRKVSNRRSHYGRFEKFGLAVLLCSEAVLGTLAFSASPASAAPVSVNVCFKTGSELDLNSAANANTKAKLTNAAYFGTGGTAAPETFVFKTLASVTAATLSSNGCQIYFGGGATGQDVTSAEAAVLTTWRQTTGHFLLAGCDYPANVICSSSGRTLTSIANGGVSINSLLSYNPLTCGGALSVATFGGASTYLGMLAGDALLAKHNTALQQPAAITDNLVTPTFLFTADADMYGSNGASAIGAGATATTDQAIFVVNSFKFALDAIMGRLVNPQCFASYNQKADLALSISTTNASPAVGGQTTVTVTVINQGPSNVTGVTAIANLPSGLTLASQSGTGTYSTSTQAWSIGSLANGASASITLTLNVNSPGSFSIPAQITQSSLADVDSSTNVGFGVDDLADGIADDDEASVNLLTVAPSISIDGKVWNDADTDLTINGSEAGTNAGSTTLTVYAINTTTGKVIDKATVNATDGNYQLSGIPANLVGLKLRLSNNAALQIGDDAPASPSIPTGWFFTGESLNGSIDPVIATLGDIVLSTTTLNLTNENFGIRQSYTIAADPAPTTCAPDFRTTINTGIDTNGNALSVGSNDLNWTAEWITGPATGLYTPYATPRPVGVMPAVVTGKLAPTWINELTNAKWISYPFRLSPNSSGDHRDANLDGTSNQQTDTVRVKYTARVTLPSNANTISVSVPVGVSVDNQFVSAKVNGVENITTPTQNAYVQGFTSLQSFNLSQGWQAGVNTIEIVTDSGPPLTGFFLSVDAATTQVCNSPNVLLVKRITGVNGSSNNGSIALGTYDPETNTSSPSYAYDKNIIQAGLTPPSSDKWPNTTGATSSTFLLGARDGGTTKTGDEIEYTIYFLSTGIGSAKNVTICDRIPRHQTFVPDAFNSLTAAPNTTPASPTGDRGIAVFQGSTTNADTVYGYTNIGDGDAARYYPPGSALPSACTQPTLAEDNGTIVVNLGNVPNATTPGTPKESYGFLRFRAKVK